MHAVGNVLMYDPEDMKHFNSRLASCPICKAETGIRCKDAQGQPQAPSHLERARNSRWMALFAFEKMDCETLA